MNETPARIKELSNSMSKAAEHLRASLVLCKELGSGFDSTRTACERAAIGVLEVLAVDLRALGSRVEVDALLLRLKKDAWT